MGVRKCRPMINTLGHEMLSPNVIFENLELHIVSVSQFTSNQMGYCKIYCVVLQNQKPGIFEESGEDLARSYLS